ncbi:MAG: COX15/CtaA family protein [Proteobacteria bacterium]|nr:COX15/CtaA family protein [Pseudomonadota bacterium]
MIFAMVVIGGVTRLTQSGLSMVEWKPLLGIVPPLGDGEWRELFREYQRYPEYRVLNSAMTLDDFKLIFWFEYTHRLWGRLIGLVFLVPFLTFLARGRIGKRLGLHLAVIFALGALQGLLGWYMVKSGLIKDPTVSQYRLAAHLAAAFAIYAYILWIALGLLAGRAVRARRSGVRGLKRLAVFVIALVSLTVMSGAFVAGIDAGLGYNTFPLMGGRWVPDEIFLLDPPMANFFENAATVQFNHRVLGILTLATIILLWLVSRRFELPARARLALGLTLAMAVLQLALGIATLLLVVPVSLAAAHQAGALALFTLTLVAVHELSAAPRRPLTTL